MEYLDEIGCSVVWYWGPGVTDVGGFQRPMLKRAGNLLRASVLVCFFAVILVTPGSFVFYRWVVRYDFQRSRGSTCYEDVARTAMPLFLEWPRSGSPCWCARL